MPNYCCFLHPEYSDEAKAPDDLCPECGRPFSFPLSDHPPEVLGYRIVKPLGRGFYSAAYEAKVGPFGRNKVLKIAPHSVYEKFGKDFEAECRDHASVAENCLHIVNIDDMRSGEMISFGEVTLECHVAVLDYVEGPSLGEYLEASQRLSGPTVAQIAVDLFAILRELELNAVHHNDLHAGNLIVQQLPDDGRRADAEDETIRLVAIDLNSVSGTSKSNPEAQRLGDLQWVVRHLRSLVDRLLARPDEVSDGDYRLASVLDERAYFLSPAVTKQRTPTFDECIEDVKAALRHVSSPWSEQLRLRRFNDAYNAQTLAAWFVPHLLVDPDDRWLNAVATPGPQVITGMRGCGKTMLLRALQFHARATLTDACPTEDSVVAQLRDDRFVGLYVSATRLLESVGAEIVETDDPYAKLYVSYAIEALRAVRHLRELGRQHVTPTGYREIGRVVAEYIEGAPDIGNAGSESHLERLLLSMLVRLGHGSGELRFVGNPAVAFPQLAEAVCGCSSLWSNAPVLFLLDDVSTRYLQQERIDELMSSLIFSSPNCAFKLTTEVQTLAVILLSPGQIERARAGRDYEVFDLGAEVNELIRRKRGTSFVEQVLARRAKFYPYHPQDLAPRDILGDATMESVASHIGSTSRTSNERKKVYHGISVLAGVCVGDIGDAISIYESILRKAVGQSIPIDPRLQTACYQEYCSRRLYDLNRRRSALREYALEFAGASHELLMQSYRDRKEDQDSQKESERRLRQYLKVYVRLTKGDTDRQFAQLRELVDAGVFVLDGGTYRSKTKDFNPIQQFKLTFRKLYGLSSFIGLAERDRFELSGDDVVQWLNIPSAGKEILMRNVGRSAEIEEDDEVHEVDEEAQPDTQERGGVQLSLFDDAATIEAPVVETIPAEAAALIDRKTPECRQLESDDLTSHTIDTIIVGLGFEERSEASIGRILQMVEPNEAIAIEYEEKGRSTEILSLLERHVQKVARVPYREVVQSGLHVPQGRLLVDTTGLAKPAIFHAIRNGLRENASLLVGHTEAESYYPLDDDIAAILNAYQHEDYYALLEKLRDVLTGEEGPYTLDALVESDADPSRRRTLCAFASPRHERLLTLLDDRQYDRVQVITQDEHTARGKIAVLSAEFATNNYPATTVEQLGTNDLLGVLSFMTRVHHEWYVDGGFNLELGLTGSKIQAVACAALSAAVKVSQVWYVRPRSFDPRRFTVGVGSSSFHKITLKLTDEER